MLAIVGTPHSVQCRQMSANVDMATFGDIWRHLATFGDIWRHLATFGDIWRHLATFVDIRGDMRPFKNDTKFRNKCSILVCFSSNR